MAGDWSHVTRRPTRCCTLHGPAALQSWRAAVWRRSLGRGARLGRRWAARVSTDPLAGAAGGEAITLQDLGNLGEILAAVGVVVSVLYLAIQVRQSTRSVRASTYQAFSESFRDFRALLVGDERLGTVWGKGLRSRSELSSSEQGQFDALLMNFLRGVEVSFYQESQGLLDAAFYEGWLDEAVEIWRQPGSREWWSANSRFFNPEFRVVWERRLTSARS